MLATYPMQSEQHTLPQNTDLKKLLIELYLVEYQTKNAAIQQKNIVFLDENELLPHIYLPGNPSANSAKDNSSLQDNMQKTSKWWQISRFILVEGVSMVAAIGIGVIIKMIIKKCSQNICLNS
ncbi:MAG: hypothetical protein OXC48_09810 [Endozoicomonadaceae bacterium]|nr:hypothetical protein [Endozoicomonadaceae bacterium]